MRRIQRIRYRLRHRLGFSLGKHWHCPACKQHWHLYSHAHQHVYAERMPCRRAVEGTGKNHAPDSPASGSRR